MNSALLIIVKTLGSDRLHFWYDDVRLMLRDHRIQGLAVQHVDDLAAIGHLHRRGPFVGVDSDDRLAVPLEGDDHFFAEFAGAEEEDFLVHAES